jgi:hypothetical protein
MPDKTYNYPVETGNYPTEPTDEQCVILLRALWHYATDTSLQDGSPR